jgi:F-type H+-transporting ATPase subunit b
LDLSLADHQLHDRGAAPAEVCLQTHPRRARRAPSADRGGLLNAEKIKAQLAEAEQRYAEILANANAAAQKMIDEARESASHVAERKQQEAVAAAEQIVAKAREASAIEHERTMLELKRELGRLVVDTTAKVTGKVLNTDDQRRLQEEAARQLAS